MKIIFIRHCEPDYENDTLTEKGWREAEYLSERVKKWNVDSFYCSPLGRAQATASLSLKKTNREAVTYDWLREFYYPITDPTTLRHGVPWDFMPSYWTKEPLFYDKDHWCDAPVFQSNPDIRPKYEEVCQGIDGLLAKYGYIREGNFYRTPLRETGISGTDNLLTHSLTPNAADTGTAALNAPYNDSTIVIFCHLGVTFAMMSHILGIAPTLLWQNFFIAPSSVTILSAEERIPCEAYFRTQVAGDTLHLHNNGEPISQAGYFAEPFQL